MKKKIRRFVLYGNVGLLILCFLLLYFDVFRSVERNLYDYDMRSTMSNAPHEDIIVIAIDEYSLESIGNFPWDRQMYIPLIDMLNLPESKAKAIAFDLLLNAQTESDPYLLETLALYDNVILPSEAITEGEFKRVLKRDGEGPMTAEQWFHPVPEFMEYTHRAHINGRTDSDGIYRKAWLQLKTPDDQVINLLGVEAARLAGADIDYLLEKNEHREVYIDYQATTNDFMTIPYIDVISGAIPLETFKDRIVFIGPTAPSLHDLGTTPVEQNIPKVYIHANIASQLLNGTFVSWTPTLFTTIVTPLMIALSALLAWRLKTVYGFAALLAVVAAWLFGQYSVFKWHSLYVDSINPVVFAIIPFIYNVSVRSYFEAKQRSFITKQFGRYISPDLVKEIAKSDQEIQLGGINKELSLLFLDVRGFTTLSERLTPQEVVGFLNMMFDLITQKALENRGTIDKFIGDAAMILFNAPLDVPNHEYYAVKTAYDIQLGMKKVREDIQEKYGATVSVGIGVHTGDVVVGNIGSFLRVDYTAIGDNVNIAARIESNTVANQVLVSEETYERTKQYFEFNCIGERMMKGKTVAVKLYEVLGLKEGVELPEPDPNVTTLGA